MAVFLVRGINPDTPPPPTGAVFDMFRRTHSRLRRSRNGGSRNHGRLRECSPALLSDAWCAEEAAVLLLRARHGADYQPPAPTGTMFSDVPQDHPLAAWIEQFAREGITAGCEGKDMPGSYRQPWRNGRSSSSLSAAIVTSCHERGVRAGDEGKRGASRSPRGICSSLVPTVEGITGGCACGCPRGLRPCRAGGLTAWGTGAEGGAEGAEEGHLSP